MLTPAADQIVVDSPSTAEAMIATATAYATTMTGRLLSSRSGAVADGPRREFVRDALIVVVGGYRLAAGELLLLDRLGRRDRLGCLIHEYRRPVSESSAPSTLSAGSAPCRVGEGADPESGPS